MQKLIEKKRLLYYQNISDSLAKKKKNTNVDIIIIFFFLNGCEAITNLIRLLIKLTISLKVLYQFETVNYKNVKFKIIKLLYRHA